jgi:hypothetical protein
MVVGIFKAETGRKAKNNPFYGNYEVNETMLKTIVNEKYEGLVPPKNGIKITIKNIDGNKITFTIGKYYFTGEYELEYNENTEFSISFSYGGRVYEACVNTNGELVRFDEWYDIGNFEYGNKPDNHYTKKSRGIKWELMGI